MVLRGGVHPGSKNSGTAPGAAAGTGWPRSCKTCLMMTKVLVPLDGSRTSEDALGPVLKLLKGARHGSTIVLLHAVTPTEYYSVTARQSVQQERRRSAAYLQQLAVRIANGAGVQ